MDIYQDHTLLSRANAASSYFHNWSLGAIIHPYDSMAWWHLPYVRASPPPLMRDDAPKSGHGFRHTKLANILLYFWCGDCDYCVDLVSVSPAVEGRCLYSLTYRSPGFHFIPFGFSTCGSFILRLSTFPTHKCRSGRRMHGYFHPPLLYSYARGCWAICLSAISGP